MNTKEYNKTKLNLVPHFISNLTGISAQNKNEGITLSSDASAFCGEYRIRTGHLLHAMQALYQMS